MYYVKNKLNEGVEIKVEIQRDDIYTNCSECGKELLVDTSVLAELLGEGNLDSTSIRCEECTKKWNNTKYRKN